MSGQEYVDLIRKQADAQVALNRGLNQIRLKQLRAGQRAGVPLEEINAGLAPFDQFASAFSDTADPLQSVLSDASDLASEAKAQLGANPDRPAPPRAMLEQLRGSTPAYAAAATTIGEQVTALLAAPPRLADAMAQKAFVRWQELARGYVAEMPQTTAQLEAWNVDQPVVWYRTLTTFLFGHDWITASFWQDWYGITPLFVGSIMVSVVALVLAVPFGVAAAIYVSEIASASEKKLIKPYLEFISAIPSVVLGFFGIAVVGQAIRTASESSWLSWIHFFPIAERLNVFTAGCLLALMAVPTIFTLSEDALRNVPRGFKEASYALGANRLQTIARVLVPASLSGIVSAILLGLGRVIGETMVVLLCAGNRIEIPDFTEGLGAFFQPVHTMTGIIAQEMGEVVRGSIHYRALFMVGLVLFFITLLINYLAQRLVARFRMSIG